MFWNEKTIQLYHDAANYCDFHQQIAAQITPFFNKADSILDIGCGHGYLDLILAKQVRQISCVDKDDAVLAALKERAPANLSIIHSAVETLNIAAHDYLIMSFFGHLTRDYQQLKQYAKKAIITIKNIKRTVIEMSGQVPLERETHGDIVAFCQARQLNYQAKTVELEFGQPFRTMTDVYHYLERYKPLSSGNYDNYLKEHLIALNETPYRYYLPKLKQVGIAIIETKK